MNTPPQVSQEIEKTAVSAAIEKLEKKSVTLDDLAKIFAPKSLLPVKPVNLPKPTSISDDERLALDHLEKVYGSVVPSARRAITVDEVAKIAEERNTLDQIERIIARRKVDIRTTLMNHFDVIEEAMARVDDTTPTDKDGHYLIPEEISIPDSEFKYTREIRQGNPGISSIKLKNLVDEKSWEAMTVEARVFDEHKAILYLREHPELLSKIAEATEPAQVTATLNIRKNK